MATDKVTRKLTTILAADVARYSRLMGADEEATARTFKSHRQAIDRLTAKHQGRVFGGAGDSVIAEFAEAVLFLLSDAAGYITGEVIRVGGGR